MKRIKALIVCCVCLVLLTACNSKSFSENTTCKQILSAAIAENGYDNTKTYIKGETELDSFSMSLWSDGTFSECEEYDLLADYAICYSADNGTYEISVLKAKNSADTEKLVSLFERRKENLSSGDRAAYDPDFKSLMSDARILTEGDFVILLITPDNDACVAAIDNLKQ